MKISIAACVLVMALLFCGCAGTHKVTIPPPDTVIDGWVNALEENKPRVAYNLLDGSVRAKIGLDAFIKLFSEHRVWLLAKAKERQDKTDGLAPEEKAEVRVGAIRLLLSRTAAGWRLQSALPPLKKGQ
jgi:hypothetical protein